MLNIEKYRDRLKNYDNSLDCDIRKIRRKNEEIKGCFGVEKSCRECRKENMQWLLAKAEILDDAEKEYLKAVIKPFRYRINAIRKYNTEKKREYIAIFIDDGCTLIDLPDFESGTMYCGIELGEKYTLEA